MNACISSPRAERRRAASALLLLIVSAAAGCALSHRPADPRGDVRLPKAPAVDEQHGALVGVVTDSASGFPVRDARIYFTRDSITDDTDPPTRRGDLPSDTTDAHGGFVIAGLPPGRLTLVARHLGYTTGKQIVVIHVLRVDSIVVPLSGTSAYVR